MILVLCLAGLNTRFHDAGFDIPKYLLPWGNSTVIDEILSNLTSQYTFEKIILIANKRDIYFKKQLADTSKHYNPDIEYIDDTNGQAHTAAIAAKMIPSTSQFMVHNGDTIIRNRDISAIRQSLIDSDAHIDIFSAVSPKYCYVNAVNGIVTSVAEKQNITEYASSGLYCFKTADLYLKNFNKTKQTRSKASEIYISDVLDTMLYTGSLITINDNSLTCTTTVIGSPQEYKDALNDNN